MGASVIRYRTTAVGAQENRELVEEVFAELAHVRPPGLRYQCVQLGTDFVHVLEDDAEQPTLPALASFQDFQRGLADRLEIPVERVPAHVVGSYASSAAVGTALAFLDAFAAGDTTGMAELLATDVVFTSPRQSLSGRAAVVAEIAGFAQVVSAITVQAAFGDHEQALVLYDMDAGPLGTIRAADRITVRDGRIVADELLFDTAVLAASG
ncbi:nuclear transport factor 2 family protein [Pseudonocardia sp. CA-107938]|uniref:nuclear transport factor 2 family protein n=1 Tax=Pseudonocardia sp. CA-107938 TaxID=3240021 RepID=UPI003D91A94A